MSPNTRETGTPLAVLTLLLALSPTPTRAAAPVHALQALPNDTSPATLLGSLSAAERDIVNKGRKLATFIPSRTRHGEQLQMSAVTIGTIDHPPRAVRGLLQQVAAYPGWLRLHPSYKDVQVKGPNRIACATGRSTSRRSKHTQHYEIRHDALGTTWVLQPRSAPLEPGSSLKWAVHEHPTRKGSSLIIYTQTALLESKGKLAKYLSSDDSNGKNRFWKDSNKHARRIHWAFDAALRFPPGDARRALYVENYVRDFSGTSPYWAK